MIRFILTFLGVLILSACAPVETEPANVPPELPVSAPVSSDDRVCSGMIAGELATCGEDEFCYIPSGQYCGAADYPGVCRPKPEVCTQQYDPVCGCDGKTYGNECTAHGAGVSVAIQGECS